MYSLASALLKFVDEQIAESTTSDDGGHGSALSVDQNGHVEQHAPGRHAGAPSSAPAPPSALDRVNAQVEKVHLATAEGRYEAAWRAWHVLDAMTNGIPPGADFTAAHDASSGEDTLSAAKAAPQLSACPYCSRRVALVAMHVKTCPQARAAGQRQGVAARSSVAQCSSDGASSSAQPAAHPLREVTLYLKSKLCDAILAAINSPHTPASRLRQLWVCGASLGDDRATAAFSSIVTRHFATFSAEVGQAMESIRAINRVALGLAGGGGGGGSGPGRPYAPPQQQAPQLQQQPSSSATSSSQPSSAGRGGRGRMSMYQQLQSQSTGGAGLGTGGVERMSGGPSQATIPAAASASKSQQPEPQPFALSNQPHLYLRRHRSALGPPGAQIDRYGRHVGGGDDDVSGSSGSDVTSVASQQPHVDALTRLLGEASQWMISVMDANSSSSGNGSDFDVGSYDEDHHADDPAISLPGVSHKCRSAVAEALHAACVASCLPVLRSYVQDTMLHSTLGVARALLEHAERCGGGNGAEDGYGDGDDVSSSDILKVEVKLDTAPQLSSSSSQMQQQQQQYHQGQRASSSSVSSGGRGTPTPPSTPTPADSNQPAARYEPLAAPLPWPPSMGPAPPPLLFIHADPARSVVDQAADQLSFACQLLERYLRCVTVCTARSSSAAQPSAMPSQDPLLQAMQELQGHYVMLEHAYVVQAVRQALAQPRRPGDSGTGWRPVAVTEDAHVRVFAWADHALFLANKALSRAAGTCCDMAAAAVVNYVSGCLDGDVRAALQACMRLAGKKRRRRSRAATSTSEGEGEGYHHYSDTVGGASLGSGDDDADEEGGDDTENGDLHAANSHPPEASSAIGGSGADDDPSLRPVYPPLPSDSALNALNTVATALSYIGALAYRATSEMQAVFPARYIDDRSYNDSAQYALPPSPLIDSPTSSSGSGSSLTSAEEEEAIHAHLRATVQPILLSPLSELHRVARIMRRYPSQAADAMASTVSRSCCRSLMASLARCSYVIASEDDYDARCAPAANPVTQAVQTQLLTRGALSATLARLAKPDVSDLLCRKVATRLARTLEHCWLGASLETEGASHLEADAAAAASSAAVDALLSSVSSDRHHAASSAFGGGVGGGPKAVNEMGALLMAHEAREAQAALAALLQGSHGTGLRAVFRPLTQALAVMSIETLSDLYCLPAAGVTACLSKQQVLGIMWQRAGQPQASATGAAPFASAGGAVAGFLQLSQAAVDAIQWDRVVVLRHGEGF